jgi:hypothetical protein
MSQNRKKDHRAAHHPANLRPSVSTPQGFLAGARVQNFCAILAYEEVLHHNQ